jgi:cation:H+ antiporter
MFIALLFLLVGCLSLYIGSDLLIKGITRTALYYGIRPFYAGIFLIAVGTALPELVVCAYATIMHMNDLAFGTIMGSNMANLGLVIGIAAIVQPIKVHIDMVRKEIPYLVFVTLIFGIMSWSNNWNVLKGGILVFCFFVFVFSLKRVISNNPRDEHELRREINNIDGRKYLLFFHIIFILGGFIILCMGGFCLIKSAVALQQILSMKPYMVGATIVSLATSLPELAIAVVGSSQRYGVLSAGNAFNSNLFQTSFVAGLCILFSPVAVGIPMFRFDVLGLIGMTFFSFFILIMDMQISRVQGVVLFIFYSIFFVIKF